MSDLTITPSGTSGAGDMVLADVQSVTGKKTFDTTKLAVKGSSTGVTTVASANAGATDYTATLQAVTGTIALSADITGTNSGTNTGDQDLSGKANIASPTFTGTVTIPTPFTLGAVSVLPTGTELNYVDGVTSAIQTQLNGKAASLGVDDNYVTDAQLVIVGNTSGTNTGDQTFNTTIAYQRSWMGI